MVSCGEEKDPTFSLLALRPLRLRWWCGLFFFFLVSHCPGHMLPVPCRHRKQGPVWSCASKSLPLLRYPPRDKVRASFQPRSEKEVLWVENLMALVSPDSKPGQEQRRHMWGCLTTAFSHQHSYQELQEVLARPCEQPGNLARKADSRNYSHWTCEHACCSHLGFPGASQAKRLSEIWLSYSAYVLFVRRLCC